LHTLVQTLLHVCTKLFLEAFTSTTHETFSLGRLLPVLLLFVLYLLGIVGAVKENARALKIYSIVQGIMVVFFILGLIYVTVTLANVQLHTIHQHDVVVDNILNDDIGSVDLSESSQAATAQPKTDKPMTKTNTEQTFFQKIQTPDSRYILLCIAALISILDLATVILAWRGYVELFNRQMDTVSTMVDSYELPSLPQQPMHIVYVPLEEYVQSSQGVVYH